MILALQSTAFSMHGGIPTYNRMVCRALNELTDFPATGEKRILIATDRPSDVESKARDLSAITLEGFNGDRIKFVRRALALAPRTDLALIGHVNYAPVGLMMRRVHRHMRYGVMVHGIEAWRRLPVLKRYALQHADFITSVSSYTKTKLVELNGVQPERVVLLPNTIAWDKNGIAEELDINDSGFPAGTMLLSVCRLESSERYKGVDTVIEALPEVIRSVPDLQYVVAGTGSDLERHKRLAVEKGVADRVHFIGSVDDATLRRCYRACDIFVLPSSGEGFGIVYLEAMHYGKPVIAAHSGAVPEVVKDSETGLLVEYGNVGQLAKAISLLCLNADLRMKFGRSGRDRLQHNFTFEQFKQKLHTIIHTELPIAVTVNAGEMARD